MSFLGGKKRARERERKILSAVGAGNRRCGEMRLRATSSGFEATLPACAQLRTEQACLSCRFPPAPSRRSHRRSRSQGVKYRVEGASHVVDASCDVCSGIKRACLRRDGPMDGPMPASEKASQKGVAGTGPELRPRACEKPTAALQSAGCAPPRDWTGDCPKLPAKTGARLHSGEELHFRP